MTLIDSPPSRPPWSISRQDSSIAFPEPPPVGSTTDGKLPVIPDYRASTLKARSDEADDTEVECCPGGCRDSSSTLPYDDSASSPTFSDSSINPAKTIESTEKTLSHEDRNSMSTVTHITLASQ